MQINRVCDDSHPRLISPLLLDDCARAEERDMTIHSGARRFDQSNALLAIAVGGLSAGIVDLAQALILFGAKVPLGIAAGLLGRQAFHGGIGVYILGVPLALLHRSFSGDCLLRRKPPAGIFEGALVDLWIVLRRCR